MTKREKVFIILPIFLVSIWIFVRLTNILQFFTSPVSSNYPTIKEGDLFFTSNLIEPQKFNFICFKVKTEEKNKEIWTHRLCGIEGDIIEFINGDLFINGTSVDDSLNIAHTYFLSLRELENIKSTIAINESNISIENDSTFVTLPMKIAKLNKLDKRRYTLSREFKNDYIKKVYNKDWNQDNFGPIKVPKGKFFVVGDNRENAQDSRYIGFVDKKDYVGTILNK